MRRRSAPAWRVDSRSLSQLRPSRELLALEQRQHLARPSDDRRGKPRQSADLDAVSYSYDPDLAMEIINGTLTAFRERAQNDRTTQAASAISFYEGQLKNAEDDRSKAQDAGPKSNARNTVSHVESCYANSQDYTKCDNAQLIANEQVPAGDLANVTVTPNGAQGYAIVATSKSGTTFTITKNPANGAVTRTCSNPGKGACPAGGNW